MRTGRRSLLVGTATIFLSWVPAAAAAGAPAAADEGQAAERLARRFAPVTMVREQQHPPCDTSEEQYEPTTVETVLGNPTVVLQREDPDGKLLDVKRAPSVADVAGLADSYYLNLNGTVLGKTCVYARDFRELVREGRAPPTTYAHIAREPGHGGFALQYWFFWYFNQFNDLHEGDWEGMQVSFEAPTPAVALERGEEPREIILFQHAGGERASWEDAKVQTDGNHPVVYPAAGSHATFYDSAVYVENGQNGSGLGCDNTSAPVRELRPRPVLLPARAPLEGRFAWLSYQGRWGEREKGYNNGPTGPATKTVWREPFTWMSEQRTTSPRMPGGSLFGGTTVTEAFCGTVAAISDLINLEAQSRPAAIASVALLGLAIALFVGLTRWGPIDLRQLRARRSFGQIVRTARRLYGRHWLPLAGIGLLAFPIVGGTIWLAGLLGTNRGVDDAAGRSGVNLALGDLIETLARPAAMAVVASVVVVFVRLLVEEEPAGIRAAFAGMRRCLWRVVGGQMLVVLAITGLAITVVGLPFAAYKYVAWSFVKQQIVFEDRGIRAAFRGSADLVRGRWWHTLRVAGFLFLVSIVTGPLLTFALIFTALPLIWINLIGALIFALLIPYVALGETLLFFDLQARAAVEPAKPRRSWKLWRPRQFGHRIGFGT